MRSISVFSELGVEYRDAGPWRSYELTAEGSTYLELLDDATIAEIDQDGGELAVYGLDDAPNEVIEAARAEILRFWWRSRQFSTFWTVPQILSWGHGDKRKVIA